MQNEDQKRQVEEFPEERWIWIYLAVIAVNALIFLAIWLFSRYFSG